MGQSSRLVFGVIAALVIAAPVSASAHCELGVVLVEPAAAFHRVSGSGFAPSEEVELQLYFNGEAVFLAPLLKTVDGDGTFFDRLTMLPRDPVGTYTMRATAASCNAEATFEWALPDTAVELRTTSGQVASIPDLTWPLVAGTLAFAYFLVASAGWAGARGRNPLPDTAVELPPAAAPSTPDLKWAFVVGMLVFAYAIISPLLTRARGRNSD